jgi:MFS family permease
MPEIPAKHDPYAALRLPAYRMYAGGYVLTVLGGQVQSSAVKWTVYEQTQSAWALGLLGLAQAIPTLVLALPAGHVADSYNRQRVLLATMLLSSTCAAGLAVVSATGSASTLALLAVYTLLLLAAVAGTFHRPARSSLLPQLISPELFPNAVTWNTSLFQLSSVAGPALGGWLVGLGAPIAFGTGAGCIFLGLLLVSRIPKPPSPAKPLQAGLSDLLAGLRFVWNTRTMFAAMTLDMFAVLFGGATYLLPIFATEILKVGPFGYGCLHSAQAIGALLMALYLAHRPPIRRSGMTLLLSVAGFGVATIIFGFSTNFWLSMAMLLTIGALDNVSVVVRHTLVQMLTPDRMRGRVSAVNQVFIGSSNELGGLESGVTAAAFGAVASVVGGGIGTIVVVATIGWMFPTLRRLGPLAELKAPNDDDLPVRDTPAIVFK